MRRVVRLAGVLTAAAMPVFAQFHLPGGAPKSDPTPKAKSGSTTAATAPPAALARFDYYVLALSWAPGKGSPFVVRGLLPETNEGPAPESCGSEKKVPKGVISLMLPLMESKAAIQQEWVKHGSCSGLSPADYFNGVMYTRSQVQIPVQMTSIEDATMESPLQIETQFSGANPGFPEGAFRVGCDRAAFTEVRVCFDPGFKPRECAATALECAAPELSIRPM
jgi:ribonuclease T2